MRYTVNTVVDRKWNKKMEGTLQSPPSKVVALEALVYAAFLDLERPSLEPVAPRP